jgi:hypothetical protein
VRAALGFGVGARRCRRAGWGAAGRERTWGAVSSDRGRRRAFARVLGWSSLFPIWPDPGSLGDPDCGLLCR